MTYRLTVYSRGAPPHERVLVGNDHALMLYVTAALFSAARALHGTGVDRIIDNALDVTGVELHRIGVRDTPVLIWRHLLSDNIHTLERPPA